MASCRTNLSQPTGKTLEEIDSLFARNKALVERLTPHSDEKEAVHQEVESVN
jgi:hypothetical protein